jgi:hypothetical protein
MSFQVLNPDPGGGGFQFRFGFEFQGDLLDLVEIGENRPRQQKGEYDPEKEDHQHFEECGKYGGTLGLGARVSRQIPF